MVQASAILSPRWRHSRTRCGLLYLLTALMVGGKKRLCYERKDAHIIHVVRSTTIKIVLTSFPTT